MRSMRLLLFLIWAVAYATSDTSAILPGLKPIHLATLERSANRIAQLLREGANINAVAVTAGGATPLHLAAGMAHSGITKFLLQHGANVDAVDSRGRTPLHEVAVWNASDWGSDDVEVKRWLKPREIADMLLQANATATTMDLDGLTPMSLATLAINREVMTALANYDKGSSVDSPFANTPYTQLHAAIQLSARGMGGRIGSANRVETLLELGADPNLPYRKGSTNVSPLRMAVEAPILISYGAKLTREEEAASLQTVTEAVGSSGLPADQTQAIDPLLINDVTELASKLDREGSQLLRDIFRPHPRAATRQQYRPISWKEILAL